MVVSEEGYNTHTLIVTRNLAVVLTSSLLSSFPRPHSHHLLLRMNADAIPWQLARRTNRIQNDRHRGFKATVDQFFDELSLLVAIERKQMVWSDLQLYLFMVLFNKYFVLPFFIS